MLKTIHHSTIIKIPFTPKKAVLALSAEAYFILSTIYYAIEDPSDTAIRSVTNFGLSRHKKYKRELVTKGYLSIEHKSKYNYTYTVGDLNG